MANGDAKPSNLTKAIRIATWILPSHRKGWAEAMLNEMAYAGSHRAALYWVLGCVLSAIRERTSYELRRTFMTRRILKTLFGLVAASAIAVVSVYTVQKPYQRERIVQVVFHGARAPAASHGGTVR